MSVKITLGAVEITVPTDELSEALKQLAPWLPAAPGATIRRQQVWSALVAGDAQMSDSASDTSSDDSGDPASRALRLFHLIDTVELFTGGASAEQVMNALDASHPKGIGSRMVAINSLLRSLGFEADEVYRHRTDQGARVWTAGPRLQEAIDKLTHTVDLA